MAHSRSARLWPWDDKQLGHDWFLSTVPRRTGLDSRPELFRSWFPAPYVSVRRARPLALSPVAAGAEPGGDLGHSILDRPQSKPGQSGRNPCHVVQAEQTNSRLIGTHYFNAAFLYWHPLGFVLWGL